MVNMTETQEAILANATYHSRLLTTIGNLEYVPSAKKHQISYIDDLEGQSTTLQKEVGQLAEKTKKERKEHETLRDSTSRRFAHKLLGKAEKYEAKANKEERYEDFCDLFTPFFFLCWGSFRLMFYEKKGIC